MKETNKTSYQAPELLVIELGEIAAVATSDVGSSGGAQGGGIPLPDVNWN